MKISIFISVLAVVLFSSRTYCQYPLSTGNPYGVGYPYNYGNTGLGTLGYPYGTMNQGNGLYGNSLYGNGLYGNGLYGNGLYGNGLYGNGLYGNGMYGTGVYGNSNGGIYGTGIGYPNSIYGNTGISGLPTYGMGGVYGGSIPLFSEQFYAIISQVLARYPMTFDDYTEAEYLENSDRCEALSELAQFHMNRQNLWRIQDPNLAYNYYTVLKSIAMARESNAMLSQQQCQRALYMILASHGQNANSNIFGK